MGKMGDNPYVGPRDFSRDESHLFFGRDSEARKLLALVMTKPLVLFYAQSGAGKSSLVNARLIPDLVDKKRLEVLPVGRVSGEFPTQVDNIYAYNLMRSLDRRQDVRERLVNLSLTEFLASLDLKEDGHFYTERPQEEIFEQVDVPKRSRVLVIDQFEELLSTYPKAWNKREDFLLQLAKAMEDDPLLSVVLVMREEFVPALDPYAHLLPGGLRARYYMQRLERAAALDAVSKPTRETCPFEEEAAAFLVDDLRRVQVQLPDGTLDPQPHLGRYVEPVQLQVVCYRLWENLPAGHERITKADLQKIGNVDESLAGFYAEQVADAAASSAASERMIRDWFDKKLISEGRIRQPVLMEPEESGGLANEAIDALLASHLIRAEKRGGVTWYELAHDRLVEPVRQNNAEWRWTNLQLFQKQATIWERQGRQESLLLRGPDLANAEEWAGAHADEVNSEERVFLKASRELQDREALEREREAERLAQERKRLLRWSIAISVMFVITAVVLTFATLLYAEAKAQSDLLTAIDKCESGIDCKADDHNDLIRLAPKATHLSLVNRACGYFTKDERAFIDYDLEVVKEICGQAVALVVWLAQDEGETMNGLEAQLTLRTRILDQTGLLRPFQRQIDKEEELPLFNQACQYGRRAWLAEELYWPACLQAVTLTLAATSKDLVQVNQACQAGLDEACPRAAELTATSKDLVLVNQTCQDGLHKACLRAVELAADSEDLVQVNQYCQDGLDEACPRAAELTAASDDLILVNQACQDDLDNACLRAVELAADSEDLTLVNQACQNGRAVGLEEDVVQPACQQVVTLAAGSEDLSLVNQACQDGLEMGLEEEVVHSACQQAIDLADRAGDFSILDDLCLSGISLACQRIVNLASERGDLDTLFFQCYTGNELACQPAVDLADANNDLVMLSDLCLLNISSACEKMEAQEPVEAGLLVAFRNCLDSTTGGAIDSNCNLVASSAGESDDPLALNKVCQDGLDAELDAEIIRPACRQALELAVSDKDQAMVNVACQRGARVGLSDDTYLSACVFTEPEGWIVFVCIIDGFQNICTLAADGSDERQLTDTAATDFYPWLSSDGTTIAFSSNRSGGLRPGGFEIWLMDADGNNPRVVQISPDQIPGDLYGPALSPDGRRLALASDDNGTQTIWVTGIDLESGKVTRPMAIFTSPRWTSNLDPVWSPDGQEIIFVSSRDGTREYFRINADGSDLRKLEMDVERIGGRSDWSPDGQWLAFYAGRLGERNIYKMHLASGEVVPLTDGGNNLAPSFSPDGNWIVYTAYHDSDDPEIYMMRTDGSDVQRITVNDRIDYQPIWGPGMTD